LRGRHLVEDGSARKSRVNPFFLEKLFEAANYVTDGIAAWLAALLRFGLRYLHHLALRTAFSFADSALKRLAFPTTTCWAKVLAASKLERDSSP
jgi:hypothetical protein